MFRAALSRIGRKPGQPEHSPIVGEARRIGRRIVSATNINDYEVIAKTVQHYLDGAKAGKGDLMKPAFHKDAAIYGYVGPDLWAGPIQSLYDWTDKTGPSKDIVGKIVAIDIAETIASVRVESDNWASYRFSDFFTLLKVDGQWKIMNKVFHLHG
jgi:Putative lumazine-binding